MDQLSVLFPVYAGDIPKNIRLALDSVLYQSVRGLGTEVLVGVDGPVGEDVYSCLKQYELNKNVRTIWFPVNRGLAVVLNDLLDICLKEGRVFVARMDADDISLPDRFNKQVDYLINHPDIDVVGGAIHEIDEEGKRSLDRKSVV